MTQEGSAHAPARSRFDRGLGIDPALKPRIYASVFESANAGALSYWLELIFAAGIATFGLVQNSPAVVIGAMLVSPLMGPILAAGLALAAADLYLGFKSLFSIVLSVAASVALSGAIAWMLPFHSPTGEIIARTQPNLLDLGVALLSGLAGSIVVCRGGGGGGVTALPGVAIAVALMPPLCTVGFGVGSGFRWEIISGAGLLFLTNLTAIVASAFLIFLGVRLHAPEVRGEIDRDVLARAASDKLFRILRRTRVARSLGDIGHLRWRALMLVIILATLYFPLREGFTRVRDEALARTWVADVVRKLVPADAVVTRQIDLSPTHLTIRLVVTSTVDHALVRQAERELVRRTGKEVSLSVRKVAGEEELALLRERLRAPAPEVVEDIASIRAELLERLDAPLKEAWPANRARLLDYELGFSPAGTLVHVKYEAVEPLEESVREMLANLLQSRLDVKPVEVTLEQIPPPPPPVQKPAAKRRPQPAAPR